ncbi:TPA: hypothetical protein DEW47_01870 [Patescibacteria group bacterium]|nr:MAG: hypothetical protein UT71_C0027G0004 [Parcubacteria group bacterium GW2011_GWF2_40_10]KKR74043.1 MAG: hypothetical protein UU18_C0035G0003 [Parcubacteria group bacterium GW2011_GWB2_40_8]KKR75601.1 MAG: hypothetical protein UU20_C0050G0003 [Parcubacteria group bacterium GW2011_GWE2_40_8]KKR80388.1 MAG: hypothetical protein UU28_C0041G0004 [Parcubacteria group bacterium GW2011_GWD2_40_9]HBB56471.1 hypothetical protein [Patescibacteria group bacterium]
MYRIIMKTLVISFIFTLIFNIVIVDYAQSAEKQGRFVVVFKDMTEKQKDKIIKEVGGSKIDHLNNASVLNANQSGINKLKTRSDVKYIEEDVQIFTLGRGASNFSNFQPKQNASWGFWKIQAQDAWNKATGKGEGIKVAVIDTGISIIHPDLVVAGGVNVIVPGRGYNDDNGHGSHVAGIIAAQDNLIGVIGVSPKVSLYAVKALDKNGAGYISSIIRGIEWAIASNMSVINLSVGSDSDSQILHDAITKATNAGIVVVVAAGNSGPNDNTVSYPAKYQEVIAVSATNQNNTITSWSSRGSEVDVAAPGENIVSTYLGKGYAMESGTSMAAPFVSGVVALIKSINISSSYDSDGDGKWDVNEVLNKIKNTATDLGESGFDNYYGYGIINANSATQ